MTQLSVMELAKQGDPQAIAALINRSLASKGIHAKAELESECLKISLQADQVPNQKAVVTIIHRGIIILQPETVKRVKILTYRADNNYLAWQHEIDLDNTPKQSSPKSHIAKPSDSPQEHNTNLVNSPKGVILVQKLSQIKQNLQEYQDIIVRFTDEHIGTVRCLTTLTELIQVISQPSFLFAAVASNPNLRSLLDTIAESSKTDEHGDQVITNLSILQPGQQWQKAKIRLVSKIFLEPAQEEHEPEVRHQGITLDLSETVPESTAYNLADANLVSPEILQEPPQSETNLLDNNLSSDSSLASITTNSLFDDFQEDTISIAQPDDQKIHSVVASSEPITVNSLFDDFQEEHLSVPQPDQSISAIDSSPASVTVNSLFDDFQEDMIPLAQSVKIVDDITESSDFSDSLFDEFMTSDSTSSYHEHLDQEDLSTQQVNDRSDAGDDLFGDFTPNDRSSSRSLESDVTGLEGDLEVVKSRIPKQNLDKLLQLMDEEDQTKAESLTVNKEVKGNSLDADLGATTIESILGNMDTISINQSQNKASLNLVTLEDFSEDLNSVGF